MPSDLPVFCIQSSQQEVEAIIHLILNERSLKLWEVACPNTQLGDFWGASFFSPRACRPGSIATHWSFWELWQHPSPVCTPLQTQGVELLGE